MSAVLDLKAKVTRLRDELRDAQDKWNRAMMAEFPIQPGAVVEVPGRGEMLVSRLTVRYDEVRVHARKKTKTGWHASENELWDASRLTAKQVTDNRTGAAHSQVAIVSK